MLVFRVYVFLLFCVFSLFLCGACVLSVCVDVGVGVGVFVFVCASVGIPIYTIFIPSLIGDVNWWIKNQRIAQSGSIQYNGAIQFFQ